MRGYIYKITNNINNKVYIGKTIQSVNRRFKQHLSKALKDEPRLKHISLYAAMRKYGTDKFKVEELESMNISSSKELNEREVYWINYFNSTDNSIGYNLTGGGDGGSNMLQSTIDKIIKTKRANNNTKLSEETKLKISKSHKGKKLTAEHKQHLSDHHHLKTVHIIYYEDGHIELSSDSIQKLADRLNTSAIKLRRASEVGDFRCGNFFLLDLTDLSSAFNHRYKFSKEKCVVDPVLKDTVTTGTLRLRYRYHLERYPNFTSYNFTKEKLCEKEQFIQKYEKIKAEALKERKI